MGFVRCVVLSAAACAAALLVIATGASAALAAEAAAPTGAAGSASAASPYAVWKHGPPADAAYFPIAVWLQDPRMAPRYKAAGFNMYVGLWQGPTEAQLAALKAAGMPVICEQNEVALKHLDDPTIVGWMHGDEPDNAQSLGEGKGYGPPVPPEKIIADYERIGKADPSRPVMLNLGQGVAWDGWYGRGVRTNHPEDYPEYARGGDVISFDIYPVAHPKPEIQGQLWYVARGVERLVTWTGGRKVVWNCVECTRIQSDHKATPAQVKAEVWMALVHGSRGLIWFVHEWNPKFNEHAVLDDPEMLSAVTAINGQIRDLAPVLNGPVVEGLAVASSAADVPVAATARRHGGALYVFAVAMRGTATTATFTAAGVREGAAVEVLGEGRRLEVKGGTFEDRFEPYGVHLYRIP